MSKYVAVMIDGELTIHIHHDTGNYATLCGIDGDDPSLGQFPADVPAGRKINCHNCKSIFLATKKIKLSDFEI